MTEPLTYEQEVHALLCAAEGNTRDLLQYFEAQAKSEKGEAKRLTQKCIEWKQDNLRRIRALIPQALERREAACAPAPTPAPSESADARAIEHGGYLADAAEQYLDERNEVDVGDQDSLNDHIRAFEDRAYEFRKRATDKFDALVALASRSVPASSAPPEVSTPIPDAPTSIPMVIDRADGSKGSWCIRRFRTEGTVHTAEYWNLGKWAAFCYVFKDNKPLADCVCELLRAASPTQEKEKA